MWKSLIVAVVLTPFWMAVADNPHAMLIVDANLQGFQATAERILCAVNLRAFC